MCNQMDDFDDYELKLSHLTTETDIHLLEAQNFDIEAL